MIEYLGDGQMYERAFVMNDAEQDCGHHRMSEPQSRETGHLHYQRLRSSRAQSS